MKFICTSIHIGDINTSQGPGGTLRYSFRDPRTSKRYLASAGSQAERVIRLLHISPHDRRNLTYTAFGVESGDEMRFIECLEIM